MILSILSYQCFFPVYPAVPPHTCPQVYFEFSASKKRPKNQYLPLGLSLELCVEFALLLRHFAGAQKIVLDDKFRCFCGFGEYSKCYLIKRVRWLGIGFAKKRALLSFWLKGFCFPEAIQWGFRLKWKHTELLVVMNANLIFILIIKTKFLLQVKAGTL